MYIIAHPHNRHCDRAALARADTALLRAVVGHHDADLGWAAGTLPSQTFFLVSVLDIGARCGLREVGDASNNRPAEAI